MPKARAAYTGLHACSSGFANIVFTSSEHYAVPISKINQLVEDLDRNNLVYHAYLTINELTKKSYDQKLKEVNKLHC